MTLTLRCRCGEVQGTVDPAAAYTLATCYCRDCQAFARFLGADGLLDAHGGTDVVPMAPSGIAFTRGLDRIACMSLSGKGLLRWYADCCRTPLGNSGRKPTPFYFGLTTACLDATDATLDASVGTRGRIVLFPKHAQGHVDPTPVRYLSGGIAIGCNILLAKLQGRRASPFFDPHEQPIRTPQVLTLEERQRLQNPADPGATGG